MLNNIEFWLPFIIFIYILSFVFNKFLYIIWVILTVISAFRYNLGTDYLAYSDIFNEIINLPYKVTNKLHGTTVVIKSCNVIGENITNDEFFIEKSQFPLSL